MKTICAWCNEVLKEGPAHDGRISHGICPRCKEKFMLSAGKFLIRQHGPLEKNKEGDKR